MRECLMILFECYDGHTYIEYSVAGEKRLGLLALCCLVVDGGDYGWLTDTRGPQSLFGCGRCFLGTSQIHCNVTDDWRRNLLRRTYRGEQAAPPPLPLPPPPPPPPPLPNTKLLHCPNVTTSAPPYSCHCHYALAR